MQGRITGYQRQDKWHSPPAPFEPRVYRTVAAMVAITLSVAFMVQGCRGRLEFSSPSSGAGRPVASGFFQSNYLSASAPGYSSFWPASIAGSLNSGPLTPDSKAAIRSAASPTIDDLLIEALILAAIEGEGCKAAGGLAAAPLYFTKMIVTAYCPLKCCCGNHADSITASGHKIEPGRGEKFAAAPAGYPFGTMFEIPGYGRAECLD